MARGKNTFNFSGGFNINSQEPIDSRFVVGLLSDLTSSATWTSDQLYNGLVVAVEESSKLYVLKDRDNFEEVESWVEIGSGKGLGSITAADYTEALTLATADNIGQIIYALAKCTVDDKEMPSGPYIVTAAGAVMQMAQSTPGGDIEGKVAELERRIVTTDASLADVSAAVDVLDASLAITDASLAITDASLAIVDASVKLIDASIAAAIATEDASMKLYVDEAVEASEEKFADVDASIAELKSDKLDKTAYDASTLKFADDKLAVNVLDSEENALGIDENGGLYVFIPDASVTGVVDGDKVLSLAGTELQSTLDLLYDSSAKEIRLTGIDGDTIATIDATDFIKDGMIDNVELSEEGGKTYLVITFNTASGKDPIKLDVSRLIDVYTAGNGIVITGKVVSVKISPDSEEFLSVENNGLKISGIQDAISAAISALDIAGLRTDVSTNTADIATLLARLNVTDSSIADVSTRLGLTDASLADVSTRLGLTDASLADVSAAVDDIAADVAEILGSYIHTVQVDASSASYLSTSTKDGVTTVSVLESVRTAIDSIADKLEVSDITEGSANGTILVKDQAVSVHGLKSAAYTESTDYLAKDALDWVSVE